ncbi:MAG TPA: hypothetical protein ENK85_05510 [Saprospiraceae bacterium]|nr:hypothetical protein [Saprospiraceae bacterium]
MDDWQLDFEWLRIRHYVKDTLNLEKLPDFNQIMVLIGIQELGILREDFSKEEKEYLLHIATCRLMTPEGYFEFDRYDDDGWPHWKELKPFSGSEEEKEKYLMRMTVPYFDKIIGN